MSLAIRLWSYGGQQRRGDLGHFCATCNRIRIAVDGTAYMSLGQDEKFEFRPLLRGGCSDAELEASIVEAINLKPERHEFREAPHKILRFMSLTGG